MMRRLRVSTAVLLALVSLTTALRAESREFPLIPPDLAQRYGLERVWFTQVPLAAGRSGIVDVRLNVSAVKAQTVFQVQTDQGRLYSISDRNLDSFGKPLGIDGAGKAAAEKVRLLRLEGIEGKIEQAVIPDIMMYVATNSGAVQAIDAETGRTLWTSSAGTMDYPTTPIAVTETHLTVINGQTLYILDTTDGAILEQRRIVGGPAAGSTICRNIAYISMFTGHLDAHTFGENAPWWPITYRSHRSVHFPPTTAGDAVVWANDVGDISVITAGKHGTRYRLRLSDAIAGPIIYFPPKQILGVTQTGYVYSFDVTNGQLMWRYASGQPSDEPAAIVGDTVFLMTRLDGMHTISATTGKRKWPSPFPLAQQFVAATAKRVYCTTTTGFLAILDGESGQLVGQVPLNPNDRVFANNQTDRLYIATRSGAIQCLREKGAEVPLLHWKDIQQETPSTEGSTEADQESPKTESVDPFSKGTAEPSEDPFEKGAAEDPKKESGDEDEDPFGGG